MGKRFQSSKRSSNFLHNFICFVLCFTLICVPCFSVQAFTLEEVNTILSVGTTIVNALNTLLGSDTADGNVYWLQRVSNYLASIDGFIDNEYYFPFINLNGTLGGQGADFIEGLSLIANSVTNIGLDTNDLNSTVASYLYYQDLDLDAIKSNLLSLVGSNSAHSVYLSSINSNLETANDYLSQLSTIGGGTSSGGSNPFYDLVSLDNYRLYRLFTSAGGSFGSNSLFMSGFSTDYSFTLSRPAYVVFGTSTGTRSRERIFYSISTSSYVESDYNNPILSPYIKGFYLPSGDYRVDGNSVMKGYSYIPLFMGTIDELPDKYRPLFGLSNYQSSLDSIVGHVDQLEGYTDSVESLLSSVDGHTLDVFNILDDSVRYYDGVESQLSTILSNYDSIFDYFDLVENQFGVIHEDLQDLDVSGGNNILFGVDFDYNDLDVDFAADLDVTLNSYPDSVDTDVTVNDFFDSLVIDDSFFSEENVLILNGSAPDVEIVDLDSFDFSYDF